MRLLICLAVLAAAFFLLPLLIADTGGAILLLLILFPLLSLAGGLFCGPFRPWYALGTAALFLGTVFLYYNETALVYAPVYGALLRKNYRLPANLHTMVISCTI